MAICDYITFDCLSIATQYHIDVRGENQSSLTNPLNRHTLYMYTARGKREIIGTYLGYRINLN